MKDASEQYFRSLINKNIPHDVGIPLTKSLVGPKKIDEDRKTDVKPENKTNTDSTQQSTSSAGILWIGGFIFLVLAIVKYVQSIHDVDGLRIANIQSTVFAAASWIVSMVCFVGARIITVIEKKE